MLVNNRIKFPVKIKNLFEQLFKDKKNKDNKLTPIKAANQHFK